MQNLPRRSLLIALSATLLLSCARERPGSRSADTTRPAGEARRAAASSVADSLAISHASHPGEWTVFKEGENQVSEDVDLDGDGRPEAISLVVDKESGDFTLSVGGARPISEDVDEDEDSELGVVDLDTGDKARELMVYTQGLSDDDSYFIYAYDGHALKRIAELRDGVSYTGNGILLNFERMGFWQREEKYVYDGGVRPLRHVPQELYYVGVSGTVMRSFPLYRTRGGSDAVATLKQGSKALILACAMRDCGDDDDSCLWYLIRSESGLVGWKQGIDFDDFNDLPWAG